MDTLSSIRHFFEAIPASLWGVALGALFSIAGVVIANRAGDRRLRAQFQHEREQKTKDREMALRKEVYLVAAEAISAGMNALGRFPNLELPNDQIASAYVEKSPAISKVHVIGQTHTVQALVKFTSQLGAVFLTLFAKRYELLQEKQAISILDDQITGFGKERDRILELIKQHNIEGIVDDRRWKVLQDNFDFEQKRVNDALARRAELFAILYPKQLEFMRECLSHTTQLGQSLIPVLSAVRTELELPLDELAYRQVVEAGLAHQQEAINSFVQKFMPNPPRTIPATT